MTNPYLTTPEAAEFVRLSHRSFERLIRDGSFEHGTHYFDRPRKGGAKTGRVHRLWKREALVAWVEARPMAPIEETEMVPLAECARRSA